MADTEVSSVVSDFIGFLNASPTAFHAVDDAKTRLQKVGYEQVVEREDWKLEAGKRYFLTRNHSTIVAFAIVLFVWQENFRYVAGNGFHIVSAHTDSPCLKLKPVSEVKKAGYLEVGRVMIREEKGGSVSYSHRLVRIEEPIMCVPTLAIHLDRGVNDGFKVELNKEFAENGLVEKTTNKSRHHAFLLQMIANKLGCQPDQICDFELQACDTQPSVVAATLKMRVVLEWWHCLIMRRLDLIQHKERISCNGIFGTHDVISLLALIDATSSDSDLENESGVRMVALFDHEEVGSNSAQGADLLQWNIWNRAILNLIMMLTKAIQRSFLVSADMAHALHPNYMDKHGESHQPKLHGVTSFIFREIAVKHNLPIQDFVVRNDMPCGSTIGPILAGGVGIRTVDIGAPQLSMHGIREMCAVDDVKHSNEHFKAFFHEFSQLDTKISVDT
ncbi:hypothetical protein GOBAR_DD01383 [Gossypium barbadense]|nr:hypothetical protein GOBAR_DD01383 [Gossypium barbadense]